MKQRLSTGIGVLLLLSALSTSVAGSTDNIFDSFGAINCEEEMARLDNVTIALQNTPTARAYFFVYGGRHGTYRDEVRVRAARMKRYLIETRSVNPDTLVFIDGGYRVSFGVEVWVVSNDQQPPTAAPSVDAKSVRFKRGKMARYREPGCFPGKYLKAPFRPGKSR